MAVAVAVAVAGSAYMATGAPTARTGYRDDLARFSGRTQWQSINQHTGVSLDSSCEQICPHEGCFVGRCFVPRGRTPLVTGGRANQPVDEGCLSTAR